MPTPYRLETPHGTTLDGLVDLPAREGPRPTVVLVHGFKGFMEWGFFPAVAALLADRGFTVVRFNFSGSGMEPGEDRATDLEGFEANTFSREQEDLRAVLDALGTEIAPGRVDRERIGLLGHSRGGGAAILTAASEAWRGRIDALVTWAAVATFERFSAEDKDRWRSEGRFPIVNSRTGQTLHLGLGLLEDFEAHAAALDIGAAAGRVACPWLVIHGAEDEAVPAAEGRELAERAEEGAAAEVVHREIPATGHTLGARHPFTGPTRELIEAINASQTWFRRHLGETGS